MKLLMIYAKRFAYTPAVKSVEDAPDVTEGAAIEDAIVGTGVWSGPGQLQEVPILGDPIGPLEQLYLPLILTAGSVEAQP